MTTKTPTTQKNATNAYRSRSLATMSIVISEHEPEIFNALQAIMHHHDGNKTQAVKQAILSYANSLQLPSHQIPTG